MPIYAYKCESCGLAKDILQKLSDPVLTQCPSCGAQALKKQLTAAGFQLKGTGWYATDFKGSAAPAATGTAPAPVTAADAKPADAGSAKTEAAPAAAAAAPAASGGCGGSCACH
jgi:putative FmdB family regulatory protein